MQLGLQNIYYYNLRLQQLRHLKTCSIEAIIDGSLNASSMTTIKNVTAEMIESIYQTERILSTLDTSKFSTEYSELVRKIDRDNICVGVSHYEREFGMPLQLDNLTETECFSV